MASRILSTATLACLLLGLAGCEDIGDFAVTSIDGSVTDLTGRGLDGIRIGVIYHVANVSAPGVRMTASDLRPAASAAEAVRLAAPFPNPTSASVRIQVTADADTSLRLEVWTEVGGVSTLVSTLHAGPITAGSREWTWDGADDFDLLPVPTGLYTVRLTVPSSGSPSTKSEAPVLINRTIQQMQALDPTYEGIGFNALSSSDGSFLVTDIAVGETFLITGDGPNPLATGLTENRVSLVFLYPDYFDNGREVVIGAGDVGSLAPVALTPKFPPAAAGPANAPAP